MAANVYDVFMLFGDSITEKSWTPGLNGFGQQLSHAYARRLDVLNRGLSGYNTKWGLPIFEQIIAKSNEKYAPKLRVLVIWFGANDACVSPSRQHVPLSDFVSNLKQMVNMIKSPSSPYYSPETRIILINPPPVNSYRTTDRLFDVTQQYADAVRDVARDESVAFVDIWTAFWKGAGESEQGLNKYLSDGLHLNEAGYAVLYDELIKTIAKEYPEVHYDKLEYVFKP